MSGFDAIFQGQRVMAILRGYPVAKSVEMACTAWDLGISAVEIPVQTPAALEVLTAVVSAGRERGMPVGAGTVISVEQVVAVRAAGAAFTVAPGFDPEVAVASASRGMPHLPGVASASEIQRALAAGLDWVKAFPAAALGESWFRLMRGPFPNLKMAATGGMSATNAQRYLEAGADVIAVGSALADDAQLSALRDVIASSTAGTGGRAR